MSMPRHHFSKRALFSGVLVIASVLLSATPLFAWQGGMRPIGPSARERDLMYRELGLRNLERVDRRSPEERRLAMAKIKEDFKQIQVLNNDVMRSLSSSQTPDYKLIVKATDEMKKCALRLKTNLYLPESEKDAKLAKPQDDKHQPQLAPALSSIDSLIASFVANPVFKSPGVIDVQFSAKARRDLDRIITLSERAQRIARQQRKTNNQTPE